MPDGGSHAVAGPDDLVQPFRIDPFALRGRLVRLGPTIDRILSQHAYPEPVAAMLGEAITLAVTLAGALKYDGIFTLQTKGDGPIRLMVADVSTAGAVRGYAQYDAAKLEAALSGVKVEAPSVPRLVGSGYIAFTVDQGEDTDRYQGIVEDGWRRAMVLMSSATAAELVDPELPPHRLLFRLFHEDGVRVYDTHSLEARCRCSRERIEGILRLFSPDELDDMRKDGVTTVTCEFCSQTYVFDEADIDRIRAA